MKLIFINSMIVFCATLIVAQEQPQLVNEFDDIIASLKSYDEQDGNYLIQVNRKRVAAQQNPIGYDAGLIRMASKISFDMTQGDEFFRPEIDEAEKMSIAGCVYRISDNQKINVERFCFSNMYATEVENNNCELFDAQQNQREIEKYGFGRNINPIKSHVYIVRLFGSFNRFKPVEVEVTTEVDLSASSNVTTSSSLPVTQDIEIPINGQSVLPEKTMPQTDSEERQEIPAQANAQVETSTFAEEPSTTTSVANVEEEEETRLSNIPQINSINPQLDNFYIEQSHSPRFNLLARIINLKNKLRMLRKSLRYQHATIDENIFEETDKPTNEGLKKSWRSKRRHVVKDTKF